MSLTLPHHLADAFDRLGLHWPAADEDALNAAGDAWWDFAGHLRDIEQRATSAAQEVWTRTEGDAADAFGVWWASEPQRHLGTDADGAATIAQALHLFAGVTIALKGVFIAQLTILAAEVAQAIATAFITFGASLAELPAFIIGVRVVVKRAIDEVIDQLVDSGIDAAVGAVTG